MIQDEATQINDRYNERIAELADFEGDDDAYDAATFGKRIPYIGWIWRDVDIAGKRIPIGNTGTLIGVMDSNKWGYPERLMTEEEAATFIGYLDAGLAAWATEREQAEQTFAELRRWFQGLRVEEAEGNK